MLHLAIKAFHPARVPFPLLHVDTGHNFPEVLEYRDATVARTGTRLVVAHVQDWIDRGVLRERPDGTRNPLQTVPLLDAIAEHRFDAVFGGGRRDEEKARAKERIFSLRDEFGQWDPRTQRPELWDLYNGRHAPGEHVRVFPLSNWTEVRRLALHRARGHRAAEHLLRPRARGVPARRHVAGRRRVGRAQGDETVEVRRVRYRTVGDMSCTGAVESDAATVAEVIAEVVGQPAHRAGRDPRRRPPVRGGHGGSQEGGVLLMAPRAAAAWPPPGPSTTASPPSSVGCSTTPSRSWPTPWTRSSRSAATAAWPRPTSRCSPTACAPSASRASRSTSPTATSPRRTGRSSSPTPPGTCSTPATWSPAPPPPSSR